MKKTSEQWCDYFNIKLGQDILDPDGWDRSNFDESWNEEITLDEFASRVMFSTIMFSPKFEKIFYEQSKRKQDEA